MADISAVSANSDSATKTSAVPSIIRSAQTPEASTPRPTHMVLMIAWAQVTPGATQTGLTLLEELVHSNSVTQFTVVGNGALPSGTGVVVSALQMFATPVLNSDTEGSQGAFQSEGAGGSNMTMQQSCALTVVMQ
jgi:hypothetical protein